MLALNKEMGQKMSRKQKVGRVPSSNSRLGHLKMLRVKRDIHLSSQLLPLQLVRPFKIRIWGREGLCHFGGKSLPRCYLLVSVMALRNLPTHVSICLRLSCIIELDFFEYYFPHAFFFVHLRGQRENDVESHAERALGVPMKALAWMKGSRSLRFAGKAIGNKRG